MALRLIDLEPPELPTAQPMDTSAMAQDMGDQAGLQPLPLDRMFRQAGRPMSPQNRNQDTAPIYGKNTSLEVNRGLHELTIQRNQKNQEVIQSWNPIEAENKQRLNNTNPNPRSKPSTPSNTTAVKFFGDLATTAEIRKRKAFSEANRDDPMWGKGSKEFNQLYGQEIEAQRKTDASLFLTSQERAAVKSMVFDYLDNRAGDRTKLNKEALPVGLNSRFPKLGNDLLYEWNTRRARQMREGTLDMLEIRRDTIKGI
jgi:hypothetical protein